MRALKLLQKLTRDPVSYLLASQAPPLRWAGERCAQAKRKSAARTYEAAQHETVSVIICAYNAGAFFENSLRSVLAQSHRALEVIVVDDASDETHDEAGGEADDEAGDDNLERIIRRLNDPRVALYRASHNAGPYIGRNFAITQASGRYITFQDADDIALPDRIKAQLGAMLSTRGAVACMGQRQHIDERGQSVAINGQRRSLGYVTLLFDRAAVVERIGYFMPVRLAGDHEYIERIKACFGARAIARTYDDIYQWRSHARSLTHSEGRAGGYGYAREGDAVRVKRGNPVRAVFEKNFAAWHKNARDAHAANPSKTATDALYHAAEAASPFDLPEAMRAPELAPTFERII